MARPDLKDNRDGLPMEPDLDPSLKTNLELSLKISEVQFLVEKNQLAAADRRLRTLMEESAIPQEMEKALVQTAVALLEKLHPAKQDDRALDIFNRCSRYLKNDPRALTLAGSIFSRRGNIDEAVHHLNKAVGLAPSSPDPYLLLGDLFAQDQPGKAMESYSQYHQRNYSVLGTRTFLKRSKSLLETKGGELAFKDLPVAVVGNFTIEPLQPYLEAECFKLRVRPRFFFGGYDQYVQEMSDPQSGLYRFKPALTFLFLDHQALLPELFGAFLETAPEERLQTAQNGLEQLRKLLEKFMELSDSKLVCGNFTLPADHYMGVFDAQMEWGQKEILLEMNKTLGNFARSFPQRLFVLDIDKVLSNCGKDVVANEKMRYLAKMTVPEKALPGLAREIVRYVRPALGMTKKCLVLDLDNTLWGGILGEDGLEGIRLDLEPPGNAFYEFQKTIKTLHHRGILLAINSKNDLELVREVFEKHPYMQLKMDDFACIRANWQDKARNMREIAQELNLGLDSFVYMDDNPAERYLIQRELPEVTTVEMPPDFSEFARTLLRLDAFEVLCLTEEDKHRKHLYQAESKRRELKNQTADLQDYLNALEIQVDVCPADRFSIPRIAQLTHRTNQFNLTTRRYSESDIARFATSAGHGVYYLKTHDRFGDHGITGVCIARKTPEAWEIDTFLMSCRIIGRGIEQAFLHRICLDARSGKARKLTARYLATRKNHIAADFLPGMNFRKISHNEIETVYELDLGEESVALPPHIKLNANHGK
ncbi:MAG: HAD-IIIC family phosphatase [Nitrospinae bacterium]|nr:HAD-IIIC family phosphatase [Nitrospinota bacterium]